MSFQIPADIHDIHGAACGHGALAAACDITVAEAMAALGKPGWINIPMMTRAIRKLGHTSHVKTLLDSGRPHRAVALLNWKGPWSDNPREQVRHRHWIAIHDCLIFDSLTCQWLAKADYDKALLNHLPEQIKGYSIATILEIHTSTALL